MRRIFYGKLNFGVSCELSEFSDEGSMSENAANIAHALLNCPYDVRGWLPKSGKALSAIAIDISKAITITICKTVEN